MDISSINVMDWRLGWFFIRVLQTEDYFRVIGKHFLK